MRILCAVLFWFSLVACDGGQDARELENRVLVARDAYSVVAVDTDASVMEADSELSVRLLAGGTSATDNVSNSALWSSSNPLVATVSDSGVVSGLTDGVTTIKATMGPLSDTVDVRVSSAPLTEIRVSAAATSINECTSTAFSASGVYAGEEEERNITRLVKWDVSDASVGVFDNKTAVGFFRSINSGTATITATRSELPGTATINVLDNLNAITVPNPAVRLTTSKSVAYTAIASFDDVTDAIDITDSASWVLASSRSGFGSVDNTLPDKGTVRASRTGAATLTVSCGGQSTSVSILSGSATKVVGFFLDPDEDIVREPFVEPTTLELRSFVRFEDRTNKDVTRDSNWTITSSTNESMTVSDIIGSKGRVTIQGRGRITVSAEYVDTSTDIAVRYQQSIDVDFF